MQGSIRNVRLPALGWTSFKTNTKCHLTRCLHSFSAIESQLDQNDNIYGISRREYKHFESPRTENWTKIMHTKQTFWTKGVETLKSLLGLAGNRWLLIIIEKICLVPRRLSRCARKGRREGAVCTLPMVPYGSSPVTRFALASAMRKTKRLRRRLRKNRVPLDRVYNHGTTERIKSRLSRGLLKHAH